MNNLEYIIPVASIFISYILGRLESTMKRTNDIEKERYVNFYAPYISKLCAGLIWSNKYSSLDLGARSVFFDLIMNNVQHLDSNTLKLLPDFYLNFLDMLELEENQLLDDDTSELLVAAVDDTFDKINLSILSQAQILGAKLKMPPLGETILNIYSQSVRSYKI
jgi:hypothetical protein